MGIHLRHIVGLFARSHRSTLRIQMTKTTRREKKFPHYFRGAHKCACVRVSILFRHEIIFFSLLFLLKSTTQVAIVAVRASVSSNYMANGTKWHTYTQHAVVASCCTLQQCNAAVHFIMYVRHEMTQSKKRKTNHVINDPL